MSETPARAVPLRALILALVPLPAMAACPGQTYLSCPTDSGGYLEVCIGADDFTYAYGPQGAPDLTLSVPLAAGTVTPWSGFGRAIWSAVGFPNAGDTYEAWTSVDRDPDNVTPMGGVNVLRGDDPVARIACLAGTVTTPAFLLEDAMAAAGYCWDLDAFRWARGTCK